MSLLYEQPITSYFRRVNTGIHKENLPAARRKRSREEQRGAFEGRKGVKGEKRRKPLRDARFEDRGSITAGNSSPTRSSSSQVSPPSAGVKHTRSFLKTPPPTDPPAKRRRLQKYPEASPLASPSERHSYKAITSLPTPLTVARLPRTRSLIRPSGVPDTPCNRGSIENLDLVQLGVNVADNGVCVNESSPRRFHSVIPSSQSQDRHVYGESQSLLGGNVSLATTSVSAFPPLPTLHPITREAGIACLNHPVQGGEVVFPSAIDTDAVDSSQSQPLLANRDLGDTISRSSTIFGDFVPSSQSQEKELAMSSLISMAKSLSTQGLHIEKDDVTLGRCSVRKPYRRAANIPQRTASDELFCVSIQDTNFSDIFQVDESYSVVIAQEKAQAGLLPVPKDLDDSSTESESEFELEEPPANSSVFHPLGSIQQSSAGDATQGRDTSDVVGGSTGDVNSTESLPSAVKDFQVMFGNDEGSYPADFPMSLR